MSLRKPPTVNPARITPTFSSALGGKEHDAELKVDLTSWLEADRRNVQKSTGQRIARRKAPIINWQETRYQGKAQSMEGEPPLLGLPENILKTKEKETGLSGILCLTSRIAPLFRRGPAFESTCGAN